MADTTRLTLPLLAAAQAQKHVTMNEALTRLDALTAPTALSATIAAPPAAAEGDLFIVPEGASGEWAGREDDLAFFSNGGWDFAAPRAGWRVWVEDEGSARTFAGGWRPDLASGVLAGSFTQSRVATGDAALSGATVTTGVAIPDRAVVLGVTARVTSSITGAGVTGFRIGVAGAADRYGSGIGLVKDSAANGVTGAPVAYYAATPLVIEAEGGAFDGGTVRLAVHYLALTVPDAV